MKKLFSFFMFLLLFMFLSPNVTNAEVDAQKKWEIQFNTDMDAKTIKDNSIQVTDLNGNAVDVEVEVVSPKKVVVHAPDQGYSPGRSYLMHISSKIKSESGNPLKENLVLDFTIYSDSQSSNTSTPKVYDHKIKEKLDAFNPAILLDRFDINKKEIDLMGIAKNNRNLSKRLEIEEDQLSINTEDGIVPLDLNSTYKLKVYMKNGKRHYIQFGTSGLPDLPTDTEGGVVMIPADPSEGFNYPYFLRIPSDQYRDQNEGEERRLMVVTNNTGATNDYMSTLERTREELHGYILSSEIPDKLWVPTLMPAFPRYRVSYDRGYFYSHALDRYTMNLNQMFSDIQNNQRFLSRLESEDLNLNDIENMKRIDLQLEAMIDHAINYLNERDQGIETDKVFLSGYSAEGNFTNRWAALHPDRVKAVASGGVNSTAIIPMESYQNTELIYPIGVGDFEELIGKPFDLEAYNQVANFMYQGEDDRNDTYKYSDTFGTKEKQLIKDFMGEEMYPTRWENNKKLYFQSGAKGAFGLYMDAGHEINDAMMRDLVEFFKRNRSSSSPVYPESSGYVDVDTGGK